MSEIVRPLEGVRVAELGTFVAIPVCARYLGDLGADVIKVESRAGDNLRMKGTALNEGRSTDPYENTTMDLENSNKRGLVLNLKDERGKEAFLKLLETADVFLTNWRPQALERAGLDYASLKQRYPSLVFATLTGYGEKGPDKDLPGFDFTAFFARGGLLGTLYQKGTEPFKAIGGLGDSQAAMALASGVIAALYRREKTGKGDKVSTNLMHTSIFTQGIMVQAAQYKGMGIEYPYDHRLNPNPWELAYRTADDRFLQLACPNYDIYFEKMIAVLGREDLLKDERYYPYEGLVAAGRSLEMYDITAAAIASQPLAYWKKAITAADIPHSVCQLWEEVLEDEQAWAVDVFYKQKYYNGAERVLVRTPVIMEDTPLPETRPHPWLGEHSAQILAELGYSPSEIEEMMVEGVAYTDTEAPPRDYL